LQQGEAIEAGGFRGRSNKLVDGCYSWWVGGGVPVVEALARRERGDSDDESEEGESIDPFRAELMIARPPLFNPG
jgi:protein farnesyltransferase subunit beta